MMVAEARKPEGDAQEAFGFQPKGLHIIRQSLRWRSHGGKDEV